MQHPLKIIAFTVIGFAGYYWLRESYFPSLYDYLQEVLSTRAGGYGLTYLLVGLPIFFAVLILHRPSQFLSVLGLDRGFLPGFLVGVVATLPMFAGYALVFAWNEELSWLNIFTGAICAAFFEELYFRAFLFGQLYRFTRLGFFPALLIGALIFASGHLYQSSDLGVMVGIFLTTFLGAGLFAWLYVEWDYNLWVPIWLHLLMNLSWMLFAAGENALGGMYSNLFRIMTIVLVIVGTIRFKKRRGKPLAVNRETVWMRSMVDGRK